MPQAQLKLTDPVFVPTRDEPFKGMTRPRLNEPAVLLQEGRIGMTRGGGFVYIGAQRRKKTSGAAIAFFDVHYADGTVHPHRCGGIREGWHSSFTGNHRDIIGVMTAPPSIYGVMRTTEGNLLGLHNLDAGLRVGAILKQSAEALNGTIGDNAGLYASVRQDMSFTERYWDAMGDKNIAVVQPTVEPPSFQKPSYYKPASKAKDTKKAKAPVSQYHKTGAVHRINGDQGGMTISSPAINDVTNGVLVGGQVFSITEAIPGVVRLVIGAYASAALRDRCDFNEEALTDLITQLQGVQAAMKRG